MENLKTLLNNCNSQYEFVKLGDLEPVVHNVAFLDVAF